MIGDAKDVQRAISDFYKNKKRDDLLLFYSPVTGCSMADRLHFAVKDLEYLDSTAPGLVLSTQK